MKHVKHLFKYCLLITVAIFVFSSKAYTQDTSYVDRLIDSAHFQKHKNYKYSIGLATNALKIARDSGYVKSEIDVMNLLGYMHYFYLSQYDSAYHYIYKAYDLSESNNYKRGISEYYLLKGAISQYYCNNTQAKFFFSKSLELARQINDKELLAKSQNGLGIVLLGEGLFATALNTVDKAVFNFIEIGDKYGEAGMYFFKGLIFFESNDINNALVFIKKAKNVYEELNDSLRILECDFQEAIIWVDKKEYNKAIQILKKCSDYIARDDQYLKYSAKNILSYIYGELKQYDKAYKLQEEYIDFTDSVCSVEHFNKTHNLQIESDNAVQEKEKQALKKENEIKSLKIKKNIIIIWLTVFIMIQVLIFVMIIYRKYKVIKNTSEELRYQQQLIHEQEKELERRKNAKIKQSLEYKKRELAVKVFQIFQGNQLNQKILEKMQSLRFKIKTRGRHGDEVRNDIQEMISEIKFNSNVQIWNEFEIYFNKVTPGFKKWLTTKYANLTHNEIRLCIFSQLNLKIKEISNVTLQSEKSISVARSRLRKKLGIEDPNFLLSSFLHNDFLGVK